MGAANPYVVVPADQAALVAKASLREVSLRSQAQEFVPDLQWTGLLLCLASSLFSVWLISKVVGFAAAML